MARRGDIESKTISSRLPMETYIGLLQLSSSNKKTLSVYVAEMIANTIHRGGIPEPKVVEVEVIKEVHVTDPKQTEEIERLKHEMELLIRLREEVSELVTVLAKNQHPAVYQLNQVIEKIYGKQ